MELFIDTTQNAMVCALFDQSCQLFTSEVIYTQHKIEALLHFFDSIANSTLADLSAIYINLGPGSFTGSRIALLYVRTLAQVRHIPIYTTTTFALIQIQNPNLRASVQPICISATTAKSYCWFNNELALVTKVTNEYELHYADLMANFAAYRTKFQLQPPVALKPIYGANPQIGPLKKGVC